ncbi:MAG: HIT domain-containing protein [Pirellulales bacterium]|nr:HIT domain-containing protein [Pirellulales bacterium]
MDPLWAPWRLAYIQAEAVTAPEPKSHVLLPGADAECFVCRAVVDDADRENLVVDRTELSIVILNRFPYNNGHLLIAPRRHQGELAQLTPEEQLDLMQVIARQNERLQRLMRPDGFNVGLNLGRVAGAGLPGHLHWHIVPRWSGDTNFMPVLAGAKVIPQSLDALWELLTQDEPRRKQ